MPKHPRRCLAFTFTCLAALSYCLYLGSTWLPLDYSDKELAAFVSRVWDVRQQLVAGDGVPWWTPHYMNGSSYGLNYSQGLYLIPSLLLSVFVDIPAAIKLVSLISIFGGTLAMYGCVRYLLLSHHARVPGEVGKLQLTQDHLRWAAALAALAWMLHPAQIIRAAGAEHLGVIVFMPFVPLTWWTFAAALDRQRFIDIAWCAFSVAGGMWAHNKMMFVQLLFLAGYSVLWVARDPRRVALKVRVRSLAWSVSKIGAVSAALAACFIAPALIEVRHVKLFEGEPIRQWQENYAFRSVFALIDRDGIVTRDTIDGVMQAVQADGGVQSPIQLEQVRRLAGLQMESPEKYAGLALLVLLAFTMLFNRQRLDRSLYWFMVAMFLLSVMLSYGHDTLGGSNWSTWQAVFSLAGIPPRTKTLVLVVLFVAIVFLIVFARRKLTSPRKWLVGAIALGVLLLLPAFSLLANLPFFKEIRAPYVFYDVPAVFFGALLLAFFMTDTLPLSIVKRTQTAMVVGVVGILMLLDYWPYQKPMKESRVPSATLDCLRETYGSLRADSSWTKVYAISGRYFHLLGPMLSGKPQVYEAFFNWMAPRGLGLLVKNGAGSRPFLNMTAAGYVVFDKSDSANTSAHMQQLLQNLRDTFDVKSENEDFVVFRNASAHEYLTAYSKACLFVGNVRQSGPVALALQGRGWPLKHAAKSQLGDLAVSELEQYERIYVAGSSFAALNGLPPRIRAKTSLVSDGALPVVPSGIGKKLALSELHLERPRHGVIRAEFETISDSTIVIAESYFPYWTATLDGREIEVSRVSCGLMGVAVPAGKHVLTLVYQPPRVYAVGVGISMLSVIGVVIAMLRSRHQPRSQFA